MNTLVKVNGSALTISQINFLKSVRLPLITMFENQNKKKFCLMEASKKIMMVIPSLTIGQDPETLTIPKGHLFYMAKIKTSGKDKRIRLVRVKYEISGSPGTISETTIPWERFLELRDNGYILPYEVYSH